LKEDILVMIREALETHHVNEMAKKPIAFDGKTLSGSISNSLRTQDPKSPTGWSLNTNYKLKDGTVVPVGTPVDAPAMTGKNYVPKGASNTGRPKKTQASEPQAGPIGLDVSAEIEGKQTSLEFDFLNSSWPQAKKFLEAEVMAMLGDAAVDPNTKIGQYVYDAIEAAKEADLDGKLSSANNKIVLYFDPATKQLKVRSGLKEMFDPEDEDEDCGYDRNDPKHPTYRDRMISMSDMARDAARDAAAEEELGDK